MRVEKINSGAALKSPIQKIQAKTNTMPSFDSVTFSGKEEDKETKVLSLRERVLALLGKKDPTEEYERSEEIKYFMGDIREMGRRLDKDAKFYTSMLKTYTKIGKTESFKNYTCIDSKENKRLVYGALEKETGIPSSITVLTMNGGMRVLDVYEIYRGFDLFSVETSENDSKLKFSICNKKALHYVETNEKTGITKEFAPTKGGFYYFEGRKNQEGENTETINEVNFRYDENEESSATLTDDKGVKRQYRYVKETDLWQEV